MTVKILDQIQKDTLVDMYRHYNVKPSFLAREFNISRRTVYRVLNEQGIYRTPIVVPNMEPLVLRYTKFPTAIANPAVSSNSSKPNVMQRLGHAFRRMFTFQPTA